MEWSLISGDFAINIIGFVFVFLSNLIIRSPNADPNMNVAYGRSAHIMDGTWTTACTQIVCMWDTAQTSSIASNYWPFGQY